MDLAEFRDGGYLVEVNRRVLHPLGLALALEQDVETGDLRITGVQDHRDDPEGVVFGEPERIAPDVAAKAAKVGAEEKRRRPVREAALGYWIQPV